MDTDKCGKSATGVSNSVWLPYFLCLCRPDAGPTFKFQMKIFTETGENERNERNYLSNDSGMRGDLFKGAEGAGRQSRDHQTGRHPSLKSKSISVELFRVRLRNRKSLKQLEWRVTWAKRPGPRLPRRQVATALNGPHATNSLLVERGNYFVFKRIQLRHWTLI